MTKTFSTLIDIYHIYARAPRAVLALLLAAALLPAAAPASAQEKGGKPELSAAEFDERIDRVKDQDKDQTSRLKAARDLSREGGKAAKKALRKALRKEKSPHVKARLVEAFGERPDKDGVEELSGLAREDESPDVRMAAVVALGFAKDESVVPLLIEKFNDEKEALGIRLRAADALTRYPSDQVFGAYAAALDNRLKAIRVQALVSMYNAFGADKGRVRPYLERMLKDPESRETAKTYLERLGN